MTSVFMVFEVSASYVIILPVMLANVLAYLAARWLQPITFFEMVASQDGLQLPSHERQRDARPLRVEDAMRPATREWLAGGADPLPVLHPDHALDTALRLFGSRRVLPVVRELSAALQGNTSASPLMVTSVLGAYRTP